MKIIHPSGECYDLKPDTALDMSRKNPFFNEYGEQSLPITLPATEKNRRLTSYPDDLANISKHTTRRIDATIQSGIFSIKSRQAILSGKRKEGIQTSFYLNEGAFYEKYKDLQLSEVFKDKVITFSSVPDAITFVRNLMVNYDERFACFPVMAITDEANTQVGFINEIDTTKTTDNYYHLYNEEARSETIGENTISLAPGFYISPFIRGNHLLKEIFAYLGYTLNDNFFTRTTPFRDMVFLNNNIDTLIKTEIRYTQIVPDAMVSTILNVYRNRFCCEFIPNESNKTIDIVLFSEVIDAPASRDITRTLTSEPQISYPKTFRQVQLSAEKMTTIGEKKSAKRGESMYQSTENQFNTLKDLLDKYPDAKLDKTTGALSHIGFQGFSKVTETIGSLNCNYYAGGNLETEKKESPDLLIDMKKIHQGRNGATIRLYPFIGIARALNSTIVLDNTLADTSESSDKSTEKSTQELKPMLCFAHHSPSRKYDIGTIYNYDENENRLWDYTLAFNGEDGLFERFWRKFDNLLRNSLLDVSAQQLLSEEQKLSFSSYKKVILKNEELLPNEIKYSPGIRQPAECTYFTTKLYEPISSAPPEAGRIKTQTYYWEVKMTQSHTGYRYRQYKQQPTVVYPAPPTPEEYKHGGRYHQKTFDVQYANRMNVTDGSLSSPVDGTLTVWLEPRKY